MNALQFVTYDQAWKLSRLDFDEDYFGFYKNEFSNVQAHEEHVDCDSVDFINAPTFSQAFDFFDRQFDLFAVIELKSKDNLGRNYQFKIINHSDTISEDTTYSKDGFRNLYNCRKACLDKLISIMLC